MAFLLTGTDAGATTIHLPSRPAPEADAAPVPERPVAPPFERRPDGFIGVEIFGQRIRLPVTASDPDRDLDRIEFYPLRARPFGRLHTTFTLRQALAEPDKAKLAFEQEPDWVSVDILSWPGTAPLLFGRFDRRLLPQDGMYVLISPSAERSLLRGMGPNPRPPPEATSPDQDGFFVRVIPGRAGETKPDGASYRLPAERRLWRAGTDLTVVCRWVGAPVRECRQHLRTQDGRISVSWSWFEEAFPEPRWKELDLRLHEVTETLLLNEPSGTPE